MKRIEQAEVRHYLRKTLVLLPAVPGLAFGIALCLFAALGTDTSTSFQQGLGNLVGLSVGTVNLLYNSTVLLIFLFANRSLVGIGSLLVGFCLGPFMNLFQSCLQALIPQQPGLSVRILIVIAGTALTAFSLAWYVQLNMGVQPMDMLVISLSKLLKKSYGTAMYCYSFLMLAGTVLLGGDLGIGTIINFLLSGKLCDLLIPALAPLLGRLTGELESGGK